MMLPLYQGKQQKESPVSVDKFLIPIVYQDKKASHKIKLLM